MAVYNNQIVPVWTFPGRIISDADGILSPSTDSLSAYTTANTSFSNFFGGSLSVTGNISTISFGGGSVNSVSAIRANGTRVSPTAVVSGDVLGGFVTGGYRDTTFANVFSSSTQIVSRSTENWSSTAVGSMMEFRVTANTTLSPSVALTINQDKTVVVSAAGTNTYGSRFEVRGNGPLGSSSFINESGTDPGIVVSNRATSGNLEYIQFYRSTGPTFTGSITYNSGTGLTSYNTTSDTRFKENIVNSGSAINLVKAMQVRSYDWKLSDAKVPFGFVAQELYKVYPIAVTKGDDEETPKQTWALDNSVLVPVLTKAIQELTQRIERLENP